MTSQPPLDRRLLELVRCPACKATFAPPGPDTLTCTGCGRAYPVRNGVPILLVDEATAPTSATAPTAPSQPS